MNEPIAAIKPPEVKPWVRRAAEEVAIHALRDQRRVGFAIHALRLAGWLMVKDRLPEI
jgi:hypothetical protein